MLIVSLVGNALLLPLAWFFGTELLKKFNFMRQFIENTDHLVTYKWPGCFDIDIDRSPGMGNIVIRANQPFVALVGFRLSIPLIGYTGFDHFGFVASDQCGMAIFSTYLGRSPVDFQFLLSVDVSESEAKPRSSRDDQRLIPTATFPPHWYQRIGFYG